ncbi:MAG: alpha/beta fold hydrolase [Planctomycetota bacterium]|nr:MAG: alpha/beta fold hydrolase [Planctomycetota bacterium]
MNGAPHTSVADTNPQENPATRIPDESTTPGLRLFRDHPLADELARLYPFKPHFLATPGGRMHYVDEGGGEAIVLLHGNPTWSFYYRNLILALRDRYRVIAPDHMGCGLSDKPLEYPYTLGTHIENFTRLMDALDLQEVTLGVHDWGGPIGFGWAVNHPDRVRRLIVFNTSVFLGGRVPWRIRVCGWPGIGDWLMLNKNAFPRAALRMALVHRKRVTPAVRTGYLLPYDRPAHRTALLRFVRDIPTHPGIPSYTVLQGIQDCLGRLRDRPIWIGWGLKDWCFTETFLRRWRSSFPHAAVHTFPDAGHYVVEDAGERIIPLLRGFLAGG